MKINFIGIFQEMKHTLFRFPVGVAMSVFLCGIIWLTIGNFLDDEVLLSSLALSSIVTFFLSIGITLLSENNTDKKYLGDIGQVGSVIFGIVFYLSIHYTGFENFENILLFFLLFFCFFSFLFFAAFVKKIFSQSYSEFSFYAFFVKISYTLFIAILLGGILSVLGAVAIGSIDLLFDINNFPDDIYGYWISFALSVIAPYFALSNIPNKNEIDEAEALKNKFFTFVLRYVAIPFIYLYFFILYAYSIKVLLNFEDWPKGEVSWMVIGFSIFGYLTYIFTYGFEQENILVKWFRKFFPMIVIPQIFMLFYAIYLRIAQYDITVNRYFVVVFGLWLLGISLYYTFSKLKKLVFIPTSLSIIILLISVGPWGVFTLPESRQYDRLLNNLTQANILQNEKIVPLSTGKEISAELSENIYSGISYLCEFNDCEKIKTLFANELKNDYDTRKNDQYFSYSSLNDYGKWEIVSAVANSIKVNYEHRITTQENSPYIYLSTDYAKKFPVKISGYDYLVSLNNMNDQLSLSARIDEKDRVLKIYEDNILMETIVLHDIYNNLEKKYTKSTSDIEKDELTFEFSQQKYKIKLIIDNISLKNKNYQKSNEDSLNEYFPSTEGYVLISKK